MAPETRVVVVMAAQRSGSTLLATILGMVPGAVVAGELRLIWASVVQGRPCACLLRCTDCPVWQSALSHALPPGAPSPEDLFALESRLVRLRHTRRLLAANGRYANSDPLHPLAVATQRLYAAIAEANGGAVVVDASKSPAFVAFLRRVEGIDVKVVHLVRDARGTVDSWQRDKHWERDGWVEALHRRPVWRAAADWAASNVAAEAVRRSLPTVATTRLRFEDLLAEPREVIGALAAFAGLGVPATLPFEGGAALIDENHAIGGNVDRFDVGPVRLRSGASWRQTLSASRRRAVTLTMLPLLRRYGYV